MTSNFAGPLQNNGSQAAINNRIGAANGLANITRPKSKVAQGASNFFFGTSNPITESDQVNALVASGMGFQEIGTPGSAGYNTNVYNAAVDSGAIPTVNTSKTGGLFSAEGAKAVTGLVDAGVGIAGLVNAFEDRKLAKEQLAFEKAAYSRNLANQAQLINNQIDAAANIASQMNRKSGLTDTQYALEREKDMANAAKTKVQGSL